MNFHLRVSDAGFIEPLVFAVLSGAEVHVWRVRLDGERSIDGGAGLSDDERARAKRFRFEKDRARFLRGRFILRSILGRYLSIDPARIRFAYGCFGKPFLAQPTEPRIRFNLAHSENLALLVVARGCEVGVDVEKIRPEHAERDVAERFFSTREFEKLSRLPADLWPEAFFRCWTRKEAYIKAMGMGLSAPLQDFEVSLGPDEEPALLWHRTEPEQTSRWSLQELRPAAGYVGALAVEGRGWNLEWREWADSSARANL